MNTVSDIFFIDLEQTIIESWDSPDLINVGKIRKFLTDNNAKTVNIFSFAIWGEDDQRKFASKIKPSIEKALGLPVGLYPSVQDMIAADFGLTGIRFEQGHEVSEFIQLRGKKDGFINFVLAKCHFKRAILIDDVVPDLTLTHRNFGWSVELWNVDSLERV